MNQLLDKKPTVVYEIIDQFNGFYVNMIDRKYCSRVNIPLRIVTNVISNERFESLFINEAIKSNMIELKGHCSLAGIRISLYNGINFEEVTQLTEFMGTFQKKNT
ncbi:unnamed protein product [Rotaria sordida]|uniref:Uncharacterized protein n=1 Tax=Rotaria sordida TaxID=392033 RepID=A0A818KK25_9BILA|nr:unnamed protein product [Rotaria sordida]CAF3553339.1 unnamed protein product [Rotaria sordida]CAF3877215.1 unnamed protein product [Rotaria sordida]